MNRILAKANTRHVGSTLHWNHDQKPADLKIKMIATLKDWMNLGAWSFVVVGAGCAFVSRFCN